MKSIISINKKVETNLQKPRENPEASDTNSNTRRKKKPKRVPGKKPLPRVILLSTKLITDTARRKLVVIESFSGNIRSEKTEKASATYTGIPTREKPAIAAGTKGTKERS